jgi:hypothetical protein
MRGRHRLHDGASVWLGDLRGQKLCAGRLVEVGGFGRIGKGKGQVWYSLEEPVGSINDLGKNELLENLVL